MRFLLLLVIVFIIKHDVQSQIRGVVRDENGLPLFSALVVNADINDGVFTNDSGWFEIGFRGDSSTLQVSLLGFEKWEKKVSNGEFVNVILISGAKELQEVEITGDRTSAAEKVNSTQMGVDNITMVEAKQLPALFGEVDILKVVQLKPGVKSGGEGTSGFYVRGGGADQNLILIDESPVYNPGHLLGFFSLFNSDAVNDIELYKAGFPARYGGRLSSVLDVNMKNGNRQKFSGAGGIGLITSRLQLEMPLKKEKSSLLVAGRRTYLNLFTDIYNKQNEGKEDFDPIPSYHFYDFNLVADVEADPKNTFRITAYYGRDVFKFTRPSFTATFDWGNTVGSVNWKHLFNDRLSFNQTVFISAYDYRLGNSFRSGSVTVGSGLFDTGIKSELTWQPSDKHYIKGGLDAVYHTYSIGNFSFQSNRTDASSGIDRFGSGYGIYITDDIKFSEKTMLQAGLRGSAFYSDDKLYIEPEPRAALRVMVSGNTAIKTSYTRMFQYVHLVSNSGASIPTDIWHPSTKTVKPQRSDMVSAGIHSNINNNNWFLSVEGYYKDMKNAVDFKDGAEIIANTRLEEEFLTGKGWAYGSEIYIEKKKGRTTGWIGYTLSWTYRKFADINGGNKFFPRFDRRHDVSAVLMHKLNGRINLSATWVYGSGNYTTLAFGRFVFNDIVASPEFIPEYTARNNYRLPSTHRLDVALVYNFINRRGTSDLTFSIYNVYSRRNPYFIYYDEVENAAGEIVSIETKLASLFPIVPSVTYNFRF